MFLPLQGVHQGIAYRGLQLEEILPKICVCVCVRAELKHSVVI